MNKNTKDNRLIFNYIGHHPEYGKHRYICQLCGTDCDISGKLVFTGNANGVWAGENFEFPICTYCFTEKLCEVMEKMDSVMMDREIEREKRIEKLWLDYEPTC